MAKKTWALASTGDLNVSGNWVPSGVPAAADEVHFPAGSPSITGSLTSLNTSTLSGSLGRVVFEVGYAGNVAAAGSNFQFTCTSFEYNGSGTAFIDLQASAISPQILGTGSASVGYRSLYLIGSALVDVNVRGGSVGLAVQNGDSATAATVSIIGPSSDVWVGAGCTLTAAKQLNGKSEIRCAATTINCYGGNLYTKEVGAVTTINTYGGNVYPESTGTVGALNSFGGTTSFLTSGQARALSALKVNGGSVAYDPAVLTVSAFTAPDYAVRLSASKP